MPEVRFVEHSGAQILLMDFSRDSGALSVVEAAGEAMQIVRSANQPRSIRGLLDLSGTPRNRVVRDTMKKMSRSNGPYMRSVAFVGLGAVSSQVFKGLLLVTKRTNHKVFRTRREALEWLATS